MPAVLPRPTGDLPGKNYPIKVPAHEGGTQEVVFTLNRDDAGRLIEVFIWRVAPGQRAIGNALGRVLSRALQYGVPSLELARMLRSQNEGLGATPWPGGGFVLSVPDALGRLIEELEGGKAV